jgi:N-acetylmuramoyl-L-alanine amidase
MNTIKKLDISVDGKPLSYNGYLVDAKDVFINGKVLSEFVKHENEIINNVLNIKTKKNSKYLNYTIVLDKGHGGKDAGAIDEVDEKNGDYIRTLEKDLNSLVVDNIAERLEELGIEVILTRKKDEYMSLKDRTDFANKTSAILFLSVHFNASHSSARGIETFKYKNSKNQLSNDLAKNIQKELIKATEFKNRGVKEAEFWVLKHTKMAAVLVELGFITNDIEEKIIHTKEFQDKVSAAIVDGIIISLH